MRRHSRYKKLKKKNRTDTTGPLVIWRKKTFPILGYSSLLNRIISPRSYDRELAVYLSLHYLLYMDLSLNNTPYLCVFNLYIKAWQLACCLNPLYLWAWPQSICSVLWNHSLSLGYNILPEYDCAIIYSSILTLHLWARHYTRCWGCKRKKKKKTKNKTLTL